VEAQSVRDLMFVEDEARAAGVPGQREIIPGALPGEGILKTDEAKGCTLSFMVEQTNRDLYRQRPIPPYRRSLISRPR
jgi:hypothetical protein